MTLSFIDFICAHNFLKALKTNFSFLLWTIGSYMNAQYSARVKTIWVVSHKRFSVFFFLVLSLVSSLVWSGEVDSIEKVISCTSVHQPECRKHSNQNLMTVVGLLLPALSIRFYKEKRNSDFKQSCQELWCPTIN